MTSKSLDLIECLYLPLSSDDLKIDREQNNKNVILISKQSTHMLEIENFKCLFI